MIDPTLPVGAPAALPRGLPAQVGRYRVEGLLGQGGMGVVLRAVDPGLGRAVAVKLLLAGPTQGEELVRFRREAQATGQLQHPGVVTVYEVGTHAGAPFLAMELVEGGSLEDRVKAGPLEPREAARVVRDVALAVGHAHGRGIVHRDIKPANILFDRDGRAKLTDFGIARDAGSHLTRTGQLLGTPQYMAPEQAGGSAREHGPASDVHALGAVLYRALTGQLPYGGHDLTSFLNALLRKRPAPPRAHAPGLDPALEAIVLRCLEKAPADRWPSAEALAAALDGWLGSSVTGGRARGRGRGATLLVAVAAAVAGPALFLALRAPAAPGTAPPPAAAKAPAAQTPTTPAAASPPPAAKAPTTLEPIGTFGCDAWRLPRTGWRLDVSPDGRRAMVDGAAWWGTYPAYALVVDLDAGRPTHVFRAHDTSIAAMTLGPRAAFAITAGANGQLRRWDLSGPAARLTHEAGTPGLAVAADHPVALLLDDERVVVTWQRGRLEELDARDLSRRATLPSPFETAGAAAWLPGRRALLLASRDGGGTRLAVVPRDGGAPRLLPGAAPAVRHLVVEADGERALVVAEANHSYELWGVTLSGGSEATSAPARLDPRSDIRGATFLRGEVLIGVTGAILRWRGPGEYAPFAEGRLGCSAWDLAATGDDVLAAQDDDTLGWFGPDGADRRGDLVPTWPGAGNSLGTARRAAVAVLGHRDNAAAHVAVVDLERGGWEAHADVGLRGCASAVAVTPEGRTVVVGSPDGDGPTVQAFARDGLGLARRARVPGPGNGRTFSLALGPGPEEAPPALVGAEDGAVSWWPRLADGAAPVELEASRSQWASRASVAWSPDGGRLAAAGADGRAAWWPVGDRPGERVALPGVGPIDRLAFCGPDHLLGAQADGGLAAWDLRDGSVRVLGGQPSVCQSLAAAHGVALTAQARLDGRVVLWGLDPAGAPRALASVDLGAEGDLPVSLAFSEQPALRLLVLGGRGRLHAYSVR